MISRLAMQMGGGGIQIVHMSVFVWSYFTPLYMYEHRPLSMTSPFLTSGHSDKAVQVALTEVPEPIGNRKICDAHVQVHRNLHICAIM